MKLLFLSLVTLIIVIFLPSSFGSNMVLQFAGTEISAPISIVILVAIVTFLLIHHLLNFLGWVVTLPRRLTAFISGENNVEKELNNAFLYITNNQLYQANRILSSKKFDKNPIALYLRGQLAVADNNYYKAENIYSSIMEDKQTKLAAVRALTKLNIKSNNWQKAYNYAHLSYKLAKTEDSFNDLIECCIALKKWKEARKYLANMYNFGYLDNIIYNERISELHKLEGQYYIGNNELRKAVDAFKKSFLTNKNNGTLLAYADSLIMIDKLNKAQNLIENYLERDENNELIKYYSDKFQISEKTAKRLSRIAQASNNDDLKIASSKLLIKSGNIADASAILSGIDSSSKELFTLLAEYENYQNNPSKVKYWLDKAIELN